MGHKCLACGKSIKLSEVNKSYNKVTAYKGVIGVYQCPHCEAVMGQCYKGESYNIVKPYFAKEQPAKEIYYDLEVLGSNGIERRHGWFDPATGGITQVG